MRRMIGILVVIVLSIVLTAVVLSAPPQDDARTERMMAYCDALGVGCDYCHIETSYKKPTRNKKITQTMEGWVKQLRKKSDKKKITCNDCHQGKAKFLVDDKGKK